MAKLVWDKEGERYYETGVSQCALYLKSLTKEGYENGVAWNGITSISESPSGAEATDLYADDKKYLSLYSAEELSASIEAYTYPEEFKACDGSAALNNVAGIILGQQQRQMFGIAYVTTQGNDEVGNNYNKRLHLIYGCKASPSERSYSTINDSPEAITFSWELTTQKVDMSGLKTNDVSLITIDKKAIEADYPSNALNGDKSGWDLILDYVYGTDNTSASLPTPAQILKILGEEVTATLDESVVTYKKSA